MAISQQGRVFALSILGGLVAAGILAAMYSTFVQPYFDVLTEAVIDDQIADGEYDEGEFDFRLQSIRASNSWISLAWGLLGGALIGGALVYGKRTGRRVLDAVIIAAIAWFVLYVVPGLKYPASLIAFFDDDAAVTYFPLYYGYLAVSGLAAFGIVAGFRKVSSRNKLLGMGALYLAVIAAAYFAFPAYELDLHYNQQMLGSWRTFISASMTAFWFSAGLTAGLLCKYGLSKKP